MTVETCSRAQSLIKKRNVSALDESGGHGGGGVIMKGLMWFSTGPTILDNVCDNVLWLRWSGERIQTSEKTLVRFFNLQPSGRF